MKVSETGASTPVSGRRRLGRAAVALAGLLAAICGALGLLTVYAELTLPSVDGIGRATATLRVLDRQGRLIGELGGDSRPRTSVALSGVAPVLIEATVSTEDRDFFFEGAFNVRRVLHALLVDVVAGRPDQGASTITQQLAKLAFLSPDKSPLRKLREALLANRLDGSYSKGAILEKYLNLVYYGDGATGIQDAAMRFFGERADQLDLREASLLAGLPQSPAALDPYVHPDAAFARQHEVLRAMVATGAASLEQASAVDAGFGGDAPAPGDVAIRTLNQAALLADLRHGRPLTAGPAPHFVEYVREELASRLGDDAAGLVDGTLTVTTTLDLDVQRTAQETVSRGVATIGRGANNGALLMLDARNGDVLAMVGSADYQAAAIDGAYNLTTGSRRPGSTFKPIVYAQGFRSGRLRPSTVLDDTAQMSARYGGVSDDDHRFLGPITAATALVLSRNVPAEQAMDLAGASGVIDLAHRLGITSPLPPVTSTAIGASAVRMLDLATAYTAFAGGGGHVTPRAILRVVDENGNVLLDDAGGGAQIPVMSPAQAYAVTHILRGEPAAIGLDFGRDIAGKSGTTDAFDDAWYIAYTPAWVVAAWAGHTGASTEVGMDGVGGVDVGRAVAVPFVRSLATTPGFTMVDAPVCRDGRVAPVGEERCSGAQADEG